MDDDNMPWSETILFVIAFFVGAAVLTAMAMLVMLLIFGANLEGS